MTLSRFAVVVALLLQLAGLAVWSAPARAATVEHVLQQGMASLRVDHDVEVLIETPEEVLTPDLVMSTGMAARWRIYPGKKINLTGQTTPAWVRFKVKSEALAKQSWVLEIDAPLLQSVDFHQIDPGLGQVVISRRAGLRRAASDAEVFRDSVPVFPLAVGPGQHGTVLLRVAVSTPFIVPLTVWDETKFQAKRYDHAVLMGLLFGILGVMFFYNLSLYVFTRDRSFVSYSVYLLSIVLYELAVTGYGPFYVWGASDWLREQGYEFLASGSFLAAAVFFRQFLDLKSAPKHLNFMNVAIIGFWVLTCVIALFPATRQLGVLIGAGGILSVLIGLYSSAYLALRGNVLARYFVLAWGSLIVATIVMLLSIFGVLEGGGWVDYSQHIGFVLETVLLSVALAERIKREKAHREAAQRESLVLTGKFEQEREEKIRAQEHALAVQLRANEELELHVLDRTAKLKQANVELAKLSVTDALTKVHNRRYFDETLKKEHDRSARTGSPLALVLADIDHFKKINDSVGHPGGDECLKLVAAALSGTVGRSTDLVARYGGEEFAIVLPATDTAQALEVAERMRRAVESISFIYGGKRIPISISLGVVARVAQSGQPVARFVSQADEALYAAKGAGRNQVQLAANS